MKTADPEDRFRKFLSQVMKPHWRMTWHEDGDVSPGVPDLHYVIKGGGHRVGWLELKAVDGEYSASNSFDIKPSQHRYIRDQGWGEAMPIHFLIRIQDDVFLVHSRYHRELAFAKTKAEIRAISELACAAQDLELFLPVHLSEITKI